MVTTVLCFFIFFVDLSEIAMSTVVYVPTLSTHSNNQYSQHLYVFDHHHQNMFTENNTHQQETTVATNSAILPSDHFNEDEQCQICGDLASGWHCG